MQVVPTNVEKYLMAHPAVEDAAVVGLPHDIDGEWPLAFVVLSPETHVTAEELIAYMNGNNGETKYLRRNSR
jgi:acyl-coenzyme A synthetase/AMP-(fatty) acid ligase